MIISASRRTDIPNYYSEWFINRLKEKYVYVRNPISSHQVSRVDLSPELVDCIVFWTKNPKPLMDKLDQLSAYKYYIQFTLNSYGQDIEPNIPFINNEVIDTFKRLSDKIGPERVIWRYDPIFLNEKYDADYHICNFEKLAFQLKDYTEKCTISFIDDYPAIRRNIASLSIQPMSDDQARNIAASLSKTAFTYGLKMDTCAEMLELSDIGVTHARCIDDKLIERITGYPLPAEKDKNQRPVCGCAASVDVGSYNTCQNGCKYCYANHSSDAVKKNNSRYDPSSPLLCSTLGDGDNVSERHAKSSKDHQLKLFNQKEQ